MPNISTIQGTIGLPVTADASGKINFSSDGSVIISDSPSTNTLLFTAIGGGGAGILTFIEDYGMARSFFGSLNLYGSAFQGLVTTGADSTVTFFNLDWSTAQKGVGILSTNADTTTGTTKTAAVTPASLRAKLGDQTKYFIAGGTGSTTALTWLGPLLDGELLIGRTNNYPVPATLTGSGGILITLGPGQITISTKGITFVEDSGTAKASAGFLRLYGSAFQGQGTTGSGSIITFFNFDWTTTQKGVGILSTGPDTTTGTTATAAVTPATLRAKLGDQTLYSISGGAGSTAALTWLGPLTNGQLLIGATDGYPVPATLVGTSGIGISLSAGGIVISGSGVIITFVEDNGSATAMNGLLSLYGSAFQGQETTGSGNTITFFNLDWTTAQKGVGILSTGPDTTTGTTTTAAVTPVSLRAKLGDQTLYSIAGGTGSTTALTWLGPLTNGQLLIGATDGYPVPATLVGTSGIGISLSAGGIVISGSGVIITFVEDNGSATAMNGLLSLYGSAFQGQETTGSGNTITFFNLDWTTTQKGVGILSTGPDTTTGTTTTAAVTPATLRAKLGDQTLYSIAGGTGSTTALTWLGPLTNGQLLIGITGGYPVPATITSNGGDGLAGGTMLVTNGPGSIDIETLAVLQTDTGFATFSGSPPYYDDSTIGTFTVTNSGTGYINGVPISWAGGQAVSLLSGTTSYIYMDINGHIQNTIARTDNLYVNNVVLFECLRDSTTPTNYQLTAKENHSYDFPVNVSNYLHDTVGTVIENIRNGANITITTINSVGIATLDYLDDHGLITTIPDSGGAGVTWNTYFYDSNGLDKWILYSQSTTFDGSYFSGTAVLPIPVGEFGVYTLYVIKDNTTTATPQYIAVMNFAVYASLADADDAISNGLVQVASGELFQLEPAQLGFVIWEGGTGFVSETIAKSTLRSSTSSGTFAAASFITVSAAGFSGVLGPSDTNVQTALDTIDQWGVNPPYALPAGTGSPNLTGSETALTWLGPLTNGQLLIGATNGYPIPATIVGTSGIGISLSAGGIVISGSSFAITYIEDSGSATAASGLLSLYGSAYQGLGTTASGNTITFFNFDWTTTQKGVGVLSSSPDTTTGTTTTAAVTPASLGAKLGDQTQYAIGAGSGSTTALTWLGPLTNGQLLIGATGGYPIPATLVGVSGIGISLSAGGIVVSGSSFAITYIEDSGSATAASGLLSLYGSAYQGQGTTASGNTITFFNFDWTTTQKGVGVLSSGPDTTTGTTTTAAVTPASLRAKLGDQTQYAIGAGSGSTTALTWLGPLTSGQLLIGATNGFPIPATIVGTSGIGISLSAGGIVVSGSSFAITYIEDSGSATAASGLLSLYGSAYQGQGTTASGNTITFFNFDWTTTQKGVGVLSSGPDTTTGTTTTAAVTPASLRAKLGDQTMYAIGAGSGSTTALTWLGPLTNGQLLIGATGGYPIPATIVGTSGIGISLSAGGIVVSGGSFAITYIEDSGSATAASGLLYLYGSSYQGLGTTASGNTITFFNRDWTTTQKGVGVLSSSPDTTTGTTTTAAVTPASLRAKLGDQTMYAIGAGSGSTTALTWLGPLTSGQLLIGATNGFPIPATIVGTSGIGISLSAGGIVVSGSSFAITYIEDSGSATAASGLLSLYGSAYQGQGTTASGNTITFFNFDWTTTQKGVGVLSSGPDTTTGTTTTAAVTPASLRAKLGDQTMYAIGAGSGSTTALTWLGPLTNGQLLIGATGGYPIPATIVGTSGIGISLSAGGIVVSGGSFAITYIEDSGSATAASGLLYLYGSSYQGLGTTASGNTITFFNRDWTTTQKGVGVLSSSPDTTTGTTTTAAVTPASLRAKLGDQTMYAIGAGSGSTTALTWLGPLTSGQLLIGSTGAYPVANILTAGNNITIATGAGTITISAVTSTNWSDITGEQGFAAVQNGYFTTFPRIANMGMPSTATQGAEVKVVNRGGGFNVRPGINQSVVFQSLTATNPNFLTTGTAFGDIDAIYRASVSAWTIINNEATFSTATPLLQGGFSFDNLGVLHDDGTAWTCGDGSSGQIGNNTMNSYSSPVSVIGNHSFIQLQMNELGGAGLKADGTYWTWGDDTYGQLGNNSTTNSASSPISVVGAHSFIQLVGGITVFGGLKADGTAWDWGYNQYGQLGNNTENSASSPVSVIGNHSFIQLSLGSNDSYGLKADGTAWGWGYNFYGELGNNNHTQKNSPVSVVGNHSFIQISGGNYACMALKADGTAWGWGYNVVGSLGNNTINSYSSPISVVGNHSFVQVQCGTLAAVARKIDGSLWAWGNNTYGQLGNNTTTNYSSPISVVGNISFIKIAQFGAVGSNCCSSFDQYGNLWAWGGNSSGIGNNTTNSYSSPILVLNVPGTDAPTAALSWTTVATPQLFAAANTNYFTTNAGAVNVGLPNSAIQGNEIRLQNQGGGFNLRPGVGQTVNFLNVTATNPNYLGTTSANAAADIVFCSDNTWNMVNNEGVFASVTPLLQGGVGTLTLGVLHDDGTAWMCGTGVSGQIGNNTTNSYSSPVSITGSYSFIQIQTGTDNTAGLRSDGTCWTWGLNSAGQLGNNTKNSASSPVSVIGAHSFVQITGDTDLFEGLKIDGTLWTWGVNTYGQLGNNTTTSYSSPVSVIGAHSFIQISAAYRNSYGLKVDGTCWSWGDGSFGQNSDNTQNSYSSPVSVIGAHSFIQISAGLQACMALKADGTCWGWGNNTSGPLGINATGSYSSPVSVIGNHSFIQVRASDGYTVARKIDGSLWTWGNNTAGQLGNNTVTSYSSPISVVGSISFIKIAQLGTGGSSNDTTAAFDQYGNLWSWGYNSRGELGNNTQTSFSSPVLVLNVPGTVSMAAYSLSWTNIATPQLFAAVNTNYLTTYAGITNVGLASTAVASNEIRVLNQGGGFYLRPGIGQTVNFVSQSTINPSYLVTTTANASADVIFGSRSTWSLATPNQGVFASVTPLLQGGVGYANLGVLHDDGTAWTCGDGAFGVIGNNTTNSYSSPVSVVGNHSFIQLQISDYNGAGLKADGTCWTWGDDSYGQLGNNSTTNSASSPISVVGAHSFIQLSASSGGSLGGLKADGTAWDWGNNGNAQLGNLSQNSASSPVSVVGNHSFIQLSLGSNDSYGLKADGTAWGWGYNIAGELGINIRAEKNSPVSVVGNHSFIQISGGYLACMALKADGTAWGWGGGFSGALGNNTTNSYSSPVSVVGNHSFVQVQIGQFSVARKIDGSLWAWGTNGYGQLGNNTTTNYSSPISVVGNISFIKIAQVSTDGGSCNSFDQYGNLWAWGSNSPYSIGNNTTNSYSSPILVLNVPGTINMAAFSLSWTSIATPQLFAAANTNYFTTNAGAVNVGLPNSAIQGNEIRLQNQGGGFNLRPGVGQTVNFLNVTATNPNYLGTTSANAAADIVFCSDNTWNMVNNEGVFASVTPLLQGGVGTLTLGVLHDDGTAWMCGTGVSGQIGNNTTNSYSSPVSITGSYSFIQIQTGTDNTAGLRSDGTCWTWGLNSAGQLGNNTKNSASSPVSVIGAHSFIQITGDTDLFEGLKIDGTLWTWGVNTYGQLGNNTTTSYSSPVSVIGAHSFIQISAAYRNSYGLKVDGTCWSWGDGSFGQNSDNTQNSYSSPVSVIGAHSFIQISAGLQACMALKADGTCWGWGNNTSGPLGINATGSYSSPVSVIGNHSFIQVRASDGYTVARKIDGSLWTWGNNTAGQLGNNTTISYSSPISVVGSISFIKIAQLGTGGGSNDTTAAFDQYGNLWSWGYNSNGELGNNTQTSFSSPILVLNVPGTIVPILTWTSISTTPLFAAANTNYQTKYAGITNVGLASTAVAGNEIRLLNQGGGFYLRPGIGQTVNFFSQSTINPSYLVTTTTNASADVIFGSSSTWSLVTPSQGIFTTASPLFQCGFGFDTLCVLHDDGTAWTCGDGTFGQIGNNTTNSCSSPVSVIGNHSFIQISASYYSSMALKADGTCWTWGSNASGQLGNNTTNSASSPVSVVGAHSFIQLSGGYTGITGTLKADGTAWCWGDNNSGQLGNNTQNIASSPVSVVGNHSFIKLSLGIASYGLKADGTAWGWGYNGVGCLGNNATNNQSSPISVVGNHSFIQISGGYDCCMALKADGTAWGWGGGGAVLGNNTTNSYSSPISVVGNHSFVQVQAGNILSVARKIDGSLWTWGSNLNGQLGNNTFNYYSSPVSVVGNISFIKIAQVSTYANCCNSFDQYGNLWGWGGNSPFGFGNNTTNNYSSPILVLNVP